MARRQWLPVTTLDPTILKRHQPDADAPFMDTPTTMGKSPRSASIPLAFAGFGVGAVIGTLGIKLPIILGIAVFTRTRNGPSLSCNDSSFGECLIAAIGELFMLMVFVLGVVAIMAITGTALGIAGLRRVIKWREAGSTGFDLPGFGLLTASTALTMPAIWLVGLFFVSAITNLVGPL